MGHQQTMAMLVNVSHNQRVVDVIGKSLSGFSLSLANFELFRADLRQVPKSRPPSQSDVVDQIHEYPLWMDKILHQLVTIGNYEAQSTVGTGKGPLLS